MKNSLLTVFFAISLFSLFAQTPQSFQYQAVVRDASGTALVNQSVNFRISILSGSVSGTAEYVETHTGVTNAFGVVLLSIGSGTPTLGTLSGINWGTNSYFINVEADPAGGTSYLDMGTTQLLSVPYAMYSEKAGNVPVYTAGSGIDVTGTTITNTNPDQAVTLTGTGSTAVTGTYPNFTINSTDNNTIYSGGAGIDVTGTTITNTNPDQAVTLTGTGSTSVTGTYPNFTINSTDNNTTYSAGSGLSLTGTTFANTAPDQSVTMTSGTGISITGTYPSFTVANSSPNATHTGEVTGATALTITNGAVTAAKLNNMSATNGQVLKFNGINWTPSTDLDSGIPGGLNKSIQYNNAGSFGGNSNFIWDNTNERLGIGSASPTGRVVIQGSASAPASAPLFEIKNSSGQQVMAVYNDSIHFFITDMGSNQGGFAVSGRNNAKALTNDFLRINADSTRIWTSDTLKGFGVRNIGASAKSSYMQLTPNNYFIGHQSGNNINIAGGGLYNCFFGYQAGRNTSTGKSNNAIGYKSLYTNTTGSENATNGYQALYLNTTGSYNVSNGYKTLYSNTTGSYNVANGYQALYSNNNNSNVANGYQALYNNTSGQQNTAEGYQAMFSNTTGSTNVGIGNLALYTNTTFNANVAIGDQAAYYAVGGANTAVGQWSLFYNTGSNNTALGFGAFFSWSPIAYANSTALGYQAMITASNQVRIGTNSVTSIGGQVGWTTLSDGRFKKNIVENVPGLEFIKKLKPVTYTVDLVAMDDFLNLPDTLRKGKNYSESINKIHTGFIAQDVEKAASEVGFDFSGVDKPKNDKDYYGLRYSEFTVPLVKAVQEQQKMIEKLQNENEIQKNQLKELILELETLKTSLGK